MAALCLDASHETLQPLCYCHMHRIQGDVCCCLHKGSLQALQAIVMLLACHVLQTIHSLLSRGLRSALPERQFLALMKARRFLCSHSWVVLALWAGAESCWKTHSWPLKDMLRRFTTLCSMSSWYTQASVSPLSCKNEKVSPLDGTPPTKPWCRKGEGLPAPLVSFPSPHGAFEHKILLFWSYCSLMVKIFSSVKSMFSCLFLACHWRRCSAFVRQTALTARVRMCPFERWCALLCRSSLTMLDIDQVAMLISRDKILFPQQILVNLLPHCFDSGFSPRTFQASWLSPPEFLITFNCLKDVHSWNFQWFLEFETLRIGFSTIVKGNHSHVVFMTRHSMLML